MPQPRSGDRRVDAAQRPEPSVATNRTGDTLSQRVYLLRMHATEPSVIVTRRPSVIIPLVVVVVFAFAAAVAYMGYVANGIVVGDLMGVPGHEAALAVAQRRSTLFLLTFPFLQVGVIGGIYWMLTFGAEATRPVRVLVRSVVATLLSLLATLAAGGVVFSIARM